MARVNHPRCLQCGAKLPIYRKLTDAEFCSDLHRKAYQEQQQTLAIARLAETLQLCNRAADSGAAVLDVQSILAAPAGPRRAEATPSPSEATPPFAATVPLALAPVRAEIPDLISADPIAYEIELEPARPASTLPELSLAAAEKIAIVLPPRAPADNPQLSPSLTPCEHALGLLLKPAGSAPIPYRGRIEDALELCAIESFSARQNRVAEVPEPVPVVGSGHAWLPLAEIGQSRLSVEPAAPAMAGLHAIPMTTAGEANAHSSEALRWMATPSRELCKPPATSLADAPGLAAGTQLLRLNLPRTLAKQLCSSLLEPYSAVAFRPLVPALLRMLHGFVNSLDVATQRALDPPPAIAPQAPVVSAAGDWWQFRTDSLATAKPKLAVCTPAAASLPCAPKVRIEMLWAAARPTQQTRVTGMQAADSFASKPALPRGSYAPERIGNEIFGKRTMPVQAAQQAAAASRRSMSAAFRRIPISGRLMAILIPVLCFIALKPEPAEVIAATSGPEGGMKHFVDVRLSAVRRAVQHRAGVEMLDDFRNGLDNWQSRRDMTAAWSYDSTGFVKPGPLALFAPSMSMTDYEMEFLGQIDKRAMSWVLRAEDMDNYQAVKLVQLKGGPLPTVGLIRYSVVRGKEGTHKTTVLPFPVHTDTIYRIRSEARGMDYAVYVQGQLIDFWSDQRTPAGGVGFFSSKGEQSRIRWMQVSHQYDAIGRLCAYFTPFAMSTYNFQPNNGSWK